MMLGARLRRGGRLDKPKFISYSASTQAGNAISLPINKPSGVLAGDILVAALCVSASSAWTPDTGWTEVLDRGLAPGLAVMYKVATSSEPASYTFSLSGTYFSVGQILCIRPGLYDLIGSPVILSGNGNLIMPSITMAGGVLIGVVGSSYQSGRTHSTPAGMTNTARTANDDAVLSAFYQENISGASGTRTSVMAGNAGPSAGVLMGVK